MHKVRGNYSSCTCRSSENICSGSGGAQEKGQTGQNQRGEGAGREGGREGWGEEF